MSQAIHFHPVRINNHSIRIKEVALQKNGKVCHILDVSKFREKPSEVYVWKDNRDISHIDGHLMGLNPDDLMGFMQRYEYKVN